MTAAASRPQLNPALATAWRDEGTLQLGADPDRALLLRGLDPARADLVGALDGSRTREQLLRRGRALGVPESGTDELLDLLHDAGLLADAAAQHRALARLPPPARQRLAPDLASLSLLHGAEAAADVLRRRRRASVRVSGTGRVGSAVCLLLAAAGVGRVVPDDATPSTDRELAAMVGADAPAAGASQGDVAGGWPTRQEVVRRVIEAAAPEVVTTRSRRHPVPDLVVLVAGEVAAPRLREREQAWEPAADAALRADLPLLHVDLRETTGIVGPLVVPGVTACLRCLQLHRTQRDPGWARVGPELARGRTATRACDGVLATATAALAVLQALSWLDGDGGRLPGCADATLEITLPEGQTHRRPWAPHPSCGCRWAGSGG